MQTSKIIFGVALAFLAGCISNPINRTTSDNYAETCTVAEQRGNLKVAEEACYRALVNTDWGNLGEELKSEKLYNLAPRNQTRRHSAIGYLSPNEYERRFKDLTVSTSRGKDHHKAKE